MFDKVIKFFAINKNTMGLFLAVILVGTGERISERFIPLYLISLGASTLIPGFFNGIINFLNAIYSVLGAFLNDKSGFKKSLLLFNLIAMFGYFIVILIPNWIAVSIGAFFFLSWTSVSFPAVMDLITKAVNKNKQVMSVSLHSLVRRIPMALGPVLGGALIDLYGIKTGIRLSFLIAFILGLISIVIQQKLLDETIIEKSKKINYLKTFLSFKRELKVLLLSDILVKSCEQLPYAYLAIWATEHKSGALISAKQFGFLTALEMFVAISVYIPVAYFADKGNKKTIVSITFFNFTLFPLVLIFANTFYLLIVAFIARGLKEFGEPTRKSLINDLANENERTASIGVYMFLRNIFAAILPFLGGYLFTYSPKLNFFIAFLSGLSGFLIFSIYSFSQQKNKTI